MKSLEEYFIKANITCIYNIRINSSFGLYIFIFYLHTFRVELAYDSSSYHNISHFFMNNEIPNSMHATTFYNYVKSIYLLQTYG